MSRKSLFICVALFFAGMSAVFATASLTASATKSSEPNEESAELARIIKLVAEPASERLASPDLNPEDVVRLQAEALQNARSDPDAVYTCYRFAAPQNRFFIGGLERFGAVVTSMQYQGLIQAESFQFGKPVYQGSFALVTVSAFQETGQMIAYRFVLQQQTLAPYVDCWMTLAVEPALSLGANESEAQEDMDRSNPFEGRNEL
ncbi:MAG: hypothetical protein AB8B50_19310 [Pirellulaceae bacterium]